MIPVGDTPFNGIYPATICPFNAADAIDEPALARHVAAVADVPGCVGVLCNGHAGENDTLSRDEKRRVVEVVRETIGDRMIVVTGINCENSLEAVHHARDASDAGADVLMIFPPNAWALSQDSTMALTHHRMIIGAVDLPIARSDPTRDPGIATEGAHCGVGHLAAFGIPVTPAMHGERRSGTPAAATGPLRAGSDPGPAYLPPACGPETPDPGRHTRSPCVASTVPGWKRHGRR